MSVEVGDSIVEQGDDEFLYAVNSNDNLYFTKQTLVDTHKKQKTSKKNNNIELNSQNYHVEQTAIETAISDREKT